MAPGMMGQDPLQPPGDPVQAGDPTLNSTGQQDTAPTDQNNPPDPNAPDPNGGMDTAATANQPQAGDPDANTFTAMVAALRKHIFGKGEAGIIKALKGADDIGRVLGEVVFSLVFTAGHQAEQAGRDLGMDILLGVATEVIDDIAELANAYGIQINDDMKHYALLYAQQLYVQQQKPSGEDQAVAKQQLAQYKQDGSMDTAVSYVQQKGMEYGTDPFGVNQMSKRPGMMMGKDDGPPQQ